MNYQLTILTPQGRFFDGTVDFLAVPGSAGDFSVLARHAPMVASIGRGILRIKIDDKDQFFVVDGGITEVKPDDGVLVLADRVEKATDLADAERRLQVFSSGLKKAPASPSPSKH